MTGRGNGQRLARGLAFASVLLLALVPVTSAQGADEPTLRSELAEFRANVDVAVARYTSAQGNASLSPDAARDEMRNASTIVGDTFLAFESGHKDPASLNAFVQERMPASFYRSFERQVVLLRASMLPKDDGSSTPASEVNAQANVVRLALTRAETCIPDGCRAGPVGPGSQAFLLIVREGFEAILIVGAVTAYLRKSNHAEKQRLVYVGVGGALVATLITWFIIDALFAEAASATFIGREIVEGATMLLAAGVLFYVSYWLISKVESRKWMAFIDGKLKSSVVSNTRWVLPAIGFLAVYREGLETVLFLEALTIRSGPDASSGILVGIGIATVALAALYMAFHKLGVKIPLRAFFTATSALLFTLAIRYAGLGVFAFQEAGILTPTPLLGVARVIADHPLLAFVLQDVLGFVPTLEVLLVQLVLVGAAAGGAAWSLTRSRRAASA